jgi:MoaA/NifB/PqqE/SkfB family radical SAM enzyme
MSFGHPRKEEPAGMSTYILNITNRCNQKCVFCLDAGLAERGRLDLSFEETKEQIDEAKRRDFINVLFMGGETNIRKDFPDIIGYVSQLGMRPWVATNGTKFEDMAFLESLIIDNGLVGIELSYHAHEEELANKLAGGVKVYKRQEQALRNIIELKKRLGDTQELEVVFNIVLNAWNEDILPDILKHLWDVFEGDFFPRIKFKGMRPVGRADENRYIIPRYKNLAEPLNEALIFAAEHNIVSFVELVPICFLKGHERSCLETRNIVEKYVYGGWNFHTGGHEGLCDNNGYNESYLQTEPCKECTVSSICAGVWREYINIFGDEELIPSTEPLEVVAARVMKKPDEEDSDSTLSEFFNELSRKANKLGIERISKLLSEAGKATRNFPGLHDLYELPKKLPIKLPKLFK